MFHKGSFGLCEKIGVSRDMKTIVVAIGGNALVQTGQKGTIKEQKKNILICCEMIADLLEDGYHVVLTHGNGPQVGNIVIQNDMAKEITPSNPLDVCVAHTQGSLGYLISQALTNLLKMRKIQKTVVTVLTQVVVDANDPCFQKPTKFIGPFWSKEEAKLLEAEGLVMREDSGRGYRRVVASPKPLKVIEGAGINALLEAGFLVVTVGGGGIPVIEKDGQLQGIEAVIDKDFASALVAKEAHADGLIILTGVSKVAVHYGKPDMKNLDTMTVAECKAYMEAGEFPAGSMGPKVEAAMEFVEATGKEAIITSFECMREALAGGNGTRILP